MHEYKIDVSIWENEGKGIVKGAKDEESGSVEGPRGRKVLCVPASGNNQIGLKVLGE